MTRKKGQRQPALTLTEVTEHAVPLLQHFLNTVPTWVEVDRRMYPVKRIRDEGGYIIIMPEYRLPDQPIPLVGDVSPHYALSERPAPHDPDKTEETD